MKEWMRRSLILVGVYAAALLACVGMMGILNLIAPFLNWRMSAVAVWFVGCFGSLCIPDEVWDRLLRKKG